MKNSTQGFTLIELLIVIAIIGILAAVLIPNLLGAQKRAYDVSAQACGKSIQTGLATYYIDNNTYVGAPALKSVEGASTGCANVNVVVGTPTLTQNDYSFTVNDTRGKKTFTVTPSALTGS